MLFDPEKNGIRVTSTSADYNFRNRSYFELGKQRFYYKNMRIESGTVRIYSQRPIESKHSYHRLIGFVWPEDLVSKGQLEFVSPLHGRKIFAVTVNEESKKAWLQAPDKIRKAMEHIMGKTKLEYIGQPLDPESVNFGLYPVPQPLKKLISKSFRFCLNQTLKKSAVRICSPYYRIGKKGRFVYVPRKTAPPAKFVLNGRRVPAAGTLKFSDKKINFQAVLPNGFTMDIRGQAISAQFDQVLKKGDQIEIIGHGDVPEKAKPFKDSSRLLEKIGWKDTIEPEKNHWRLSIPSENPTVPALVAGIDFLGQRFSSLRFPEDRHVLLLEDPKTSTYKDEIVLRGRCTKVCNLKPEQGDSIDIDGQNFQWRVSLKKKNETEQKELRVLDGSNEWVAQHEIFRATSTELSARFSALTTLDANITILGELSASHWFENILGWDNYILSQQRWGLATKHFQTLTDIVIASGFDPLKWSTTTVDLKYRLASGVWGLQETVGLIASYQHLVLGDETVPLAGAGVYWAKSMPEIFDRMIRWLPYMDHPKWVDMEFLFYPMSIDSSNSVQSVWALNFHGKILWSESVFGEAGFGMRNIDFLGGTSGLNFKFLAAYITAGIGIQF